MYKRQVLAPLRGRHVHIWREDDAYHILLVGKDPAVAAALAALARLEDDCRTHPHNGPQLADSDEGHLLIARGDNAFLLARLFLALEEESA